MKCLIQGLILFSDAIPTNKLHIWYLEFGLLTHFICNMALQNIENILAVEMFTAIIQRDLAVLLGNITFCVSQKVKCDMCRNLTVFRRLDSHVMI